LEVETRAQVIEKIENECFWI